MRFVKVARHVSRRWPWPGSPRQPSSWPSPSPNDRSSPRCAGRCLLDTSSGGSLVSRLEGHPQYRRRAKRQSAGVQPETGSVGTFWVVLLLLVFVAPFLSDVVRIARFGRGQMLEIVLLSTVRNLGLGLAALSDRTHFARLSALTSLFLVSVSSAMVEGALMIVVVSLYAAAGCLWLMLFYWGRLRLQGLPGCTASLPLGSVGFVLILVATVLAMAAIGPSRAATDLAGLMPTSGGTWWDDPEARGGVNDGDNEVAASEKPESVGFTESEIYLETDRPSLYDAYNERYGEPFKPKKQERMIALAQQDINRQQERPAENLQAGRQFPLTRERAFATQGTAR